MASLNGMCRHHLHKLEPNGQEGEVAGKERNCVLLWAHEQLLQKPTFIVHECVKEFDIAELALIFGGLYLIRSFVFGPDDVGLPVRRPRRYTILVLNLVSAITGLTCDCDCVIGCDCDWPVIGV